VLNWRLLVEDFRPELEYYLGEKNIEADTLSRHPITETLGEAEVSNALLNYPDTVNQYPATVQRIWQMQQQSQHILDALDNDNYEYKSFGGVQVVCRQHRNGSWRIVLPGNMINDVLAWYHITLCHPGAMRMKDMIGALFTAPNLGKSIELYVERCDSCQRHKDPSRAYVELPPTEADSNPFEEVAVDLIGPWTLETEEHGQFEFSALTATCTACTLSKLARVEHKTMDHVTII
jgi:Integrase zinc binding domain